MEFRVQQEVLDLGVKILFPVVEGFSNATATDAWMAERERRLADLHERYQGVDVHAVPVLEGFNRLHDNGRIRRKKNVPASITLIKLLERRGTMPFINQVVDIYNLVSIDSGLALGAHDMDHVDGNVSLRIADGSERFVPLGEKVPVPVRAGEYCYCDDANDVLCRLEVRQVNKTATTEATTRAFFIVQGNEATTDEQVEDVAWRVVREITRYCGGAGTVVVPESY